MERILNHPDVCSFVAVAVQGIPRLLSGGGETCPPLNVDATSIWLVDPAEWGKQFGRPYRGQTALFASSPTTGPGIFWAADAAAHVFEFASGSFLTDLDGIATMFGTSDNARLGATANGFLLGIRSHMCLLTAALLAAVPPGTPSPGIGVNPAALGETFGHVLRITTASGLWPLLVRHSDLAGSPHAERLLSVKPPAAGERYADITEQTARTIGAPTTVTPGQAEFMTMVLHMVERLAKQASHDPGWMPAIALRKGGDAAGLAALADFVAGCCGVNPQADVTLASSERWSVRDALCRYMAEPLTLPVVDGKPIALVREAFTRIEQVVGRAHGDQGTVIPFRIGPIVSAVLDSTAKRTL